MSEVWRILYISGSFENALEEALYRSDRAADHKAYGLAGYANMDRMWHSENKKPKKTLPKIKGHFCAVFTKIWG